MRREPNFRGDATCDSKIFYWLQRSSAPVNRGKEGAQPVRSARALRPARPVIAMRERATARTTAPSFASQTCAEHHVVGKLEPLHPVLESAVKRALGANSKHATNPATQSERAARKAHERSRR